jgi:cytochrome c oxidase accessory protein FixG
LNTRSPDAAGDPESYYQAHQKIYPREAKGRFASLRQLAVIALLGLFYGVCWLDWNGRQAVLFDLPARKFYIFGLTMWPQDFIFLTWLLVIAALSLFFFTAVLGRVWCGYACPQTVWTEAFIWMEQWTEGNRAQRIKLDSAPWTANKIGRKMAKHSLWIGFALWTGFTFVGYFSPVRQLGSHVINLALGGWETFWILFYSFATWGNAGFLREQVCKYMCPYARFQSAMFDSDTMIVTYDGKRGEPRGARRKGDDPRTKGLGDCTDCTLCVQVCPTGIDIRKGLQYECIACAACIDACDTVMDKIGYPRGLVRYTTQHAVDHAQTHVVRPRIIVYGCLLTLLIIGFFVALALRRPVALDVLHDRNSLYRELDDGGYENVYLLKIMNKDDRAHRFTVSVQGEGQPSIDPDSRSFVVPSGEVYNAAVRLRESGHHDEAEHDNQQTREHSGHLRFNIVADDDPNLSAHAEGRFFRGKE